jgi:signal transduction histidine kinase
VDTGGEVTLADGDLRAGFAAFIAASRRLEESYVALQARAAAVDVQLQETNRRLQRALQEREAIFAALPLGLVAVRDDGAVTFCNGEGERLCAEARATGRDLVTAAAGEVEIGDGAVRIRRADLPDGELVLLEDRSRIHELERQVHRLDKLAGLSELALGVAHEIKNPLNGVMGFAALLQRQSDPEACRRYAQKIVQGLEQVDDIVKSMLAFAQRERSGGSAVPIGAVVADAAASAGLPQGRLVLSGDGALRADGQALLRVLANLFRNAREAGGADVAVRVHAAATGGRLEVDVTDDGPGVPAELGDKVFEPFVSSKERGSGLGLALSARVLAYLGGDLTLLNPGERGARFRVRLPLAAAGATA